MNLYCENFFTEFPFFCVGSSSIFWQGNVKNRQNYTNFRVYTSYVIVPLNFVLFQPSTPATYFCDITVET